MGMTWRLPSLRAAGEDSDSRTSLSDSKIPNLRTRSVALLAPVGYSAGVWLGFLLTPSQDPVSTLWPPNALLMGVLLLTPRRGWWVVVVAVLPAHLLLQLPQGIPLPTSLGWFVTNVAEALLGAACLQPFMTTPFLGSVRQVSLFVLFAGVVAPLATSFLDAAVVVLTGWASDYWTTFRMRFFANVLANLTVVPVVVALFSSALGWIRRATLPQYLEAGALAAAIVLVARFAFGGDAASPNAIPALTYTPLPILLWAAVRFGPGGLSGVLLLFAVLLILSAIHGRGPFASDSVAQNVMALQAFFILITVPLLALAALIRERRRAEHALRESEERIGFAAESAKLGFWSWDPSTAHVWATDQCRRIHGLGMNGGITWRTFVETAQPEERRRNLRGLERAALEQHPHAAQYREVLADGSIRWIEERARIVRGNGSEPARVSGVVMDITERKRAEFEAEEHRREITHLARVSMLGELSGALAHELNQPLTAILSNAQVAERLVTRRPVDLHELGEILRDIVNEDRRAGQVIKRLRALLKKEDPQLQRLDLNDVVRDVLTIVHSDLVTRNVEVENRAAPQPVWVRGDRVQLQQVLLNLILNACEAMGGLEPLARRLIIVTAHGEDGSVIVSLTDRGGGIETDRAEALFEPFFTTKEHGLGLGLTICRSIILAHHGNLWVTSNDGAGATFHVSVPMDDGIPS
jgi:PAS domain S-box-containing protein